MTLAPLHKRAKTSAPALAADTLGAADPLGATVTGDGVNFSVFSKHATSVDLLLFDHAEASTPSRVVALDPGANRTYHYWHAFIAGLRPGQIYAFRVHGPFDPSRGHRFDSEKVLLDPYGPAVVVPGGYNRSAPLNRGTTPASR